MAVMVDSIANDSWRGNIYSDMSSAEEECSEYSFAVVYTGPRPAFVPKAEPIVSFALSSDVVSSTQKSCGSPSQPQVVIESNTVCTTYEAFVNETLEELPSDKCSCFPSVHADVLPIPSRIEASRESMDPAYTDPPRIEASSRESMDPAQADLPQIEASTEYMDSAHVDLQVSDTRNISLNVLTSCRPESGYLEEEDYNTTRRSEFSGHQPFFCSSSTNGLSEESQVRTLPEVSSPLNGNERKKGECFKCAKINRMVKTETCLVCSARYCGSCVLEAMGSMPEGRKCVRCIGKSICELRRQHLGKPSKLLKRLLNTQEVQLIMEAEKECVANQVRPNQIFVNGQPLTGKELAELLGCRNPPSKLKPGKYWYDAQCGYWGKEGKQPENIICVQLGVGGYLREDASAGCTRVYINNREITQNELKMLQIAGVLCPPQTRLLLYHDGSYQEEVQNHCPGKLWDKASVRVFCHLFSLPTIPKSHGVVAPKPPRAVPAYLNSTITHKILLLGHNGCGTSTIMKQVKFLFGEDFTSKELQGIKALIQKNIYKYIVVLLEARERFEDEENVKIREMLENTASTSESDGVIKQLEKNVYTMPVRLKDQADWFQKMDAFGELEIYHPVITREDAYLLDEMWKNQAIQATYKRKAEIHMLPDAAGDFLSRVVEISADNYEPSDRDILCIGGGTQDCSVSEIQFSMDEDGAASGANHEDYVEPLAEARFHLIQSGGAITDRGKVLRMFDDVQAVVFCVALDSYDQMWSDGKSSLQNKMLVSRNMFESVVMLPAFKDKPMLIFFNKFDSFQKKLSGVPLTACEWFSAYNPVKSSKQDAEAMADQAYTYIAHMFKNHFKTINPDGGRLYTFKMQALDRSSVKDGFQNLKEIIREEWRRCVVPVTSVYTTESSSLVIGPRHRG